jgi:hypothetical protein
VAKFFDVVLCLISNLMRATKNVVNLKIRTGTNLAKFSEIKLLGTPGTPGTPGTVDRAHYKN